MFIVITGSICSGRSTLAKYLVERHGFQYIYLDRHVTVEFSDVNGHSTPGAEPDAPGPQGQSVSNRHLLAPNPEMPGDEDLPLSRLPREKLLAFMNPEEILDYVTKHSQSRFVTAELPDGDALAMYSSRPFFLLVSIDAPLSVRYKRFCAKTNSNTTPSLEAFVRLSETHLYSDPDNQPRWWSRCHAQLQYMSQAGVRLLNTSATLPQLYAALDRANLTDPERLRPSWDTYFMALASLAAQRSNCMKRRVGCVVVRDRRVISTGYNGTPRGLRNCSSGGCPRCNNPPDTGSSGSSGYGLATCLCIHAEENALLEAGRERIRDAAVLYCDTCPCLTCGIKICQAGIAEVVYSQEYVMSVEVAQVFREAGVHFRKFVPPAQGLIDLERLE